MSMGRLNALVATYHRHRFAWLFASLLLTLSTGSTLDALAPRYNPLEVLLALNLLAAIASVAHEGHLRLPLALGGAFVVTRGLRTILGGAGMLALSEALWVTMTVLATAASVRHAFQRGKVDRERILAALDAYLLVGLLFGVAYWMLDRLWPGSFGASSTDGFALPDDALTEKYALLADEKNDVKIAHYKADIAKLEGIAADVKRK